MQTPKLPGTVQVDVDELWVYYESIGHPAPDNAFTAVYDKGIPRLLALFARYGIRATFFVCGRDLPRQAGWVAEIVRQGHEVANHSTWHRSGFARLSAEEKHADIATTQTLIQQACGVRPVGFKAPGFSFAPDLWTVLAALGFRYDSTILPMPWAPLLRTLQRALSGGHVDPSHYGRASNVFAPLRPYQPASIHNQHPNGFWEVPVTTMPLLRLPMHSTFVLTTGQALFDAGLALLQAGHTPVNYLLHAADVLEAVDDPALASYHFLATPWAAKQALYNHMLRRLSDGYELVSTNEFLTRVTSP